MNKKIKGKLFCLLSAVVFLAGCNSAKEQPTDTQIDESTGNEAMLVYQPSFIELSCEMNVEDVMPSRAFDYMFVNENAVYGIAQHTDDTVHTNSNYVVIQNMDGSGYAEKQLGMLGEFYDTGDGFAGYGNSQLTLYDENFESQKEIELKEVKTALSVSGELSIEDVRIDKSGNICLVSKDGIVYMDDSGTVLRVIDMPANAGDIMFVTPSVVVTESGEWYLMCANNESKIDIYNIDMESGVLGEKLENVPDILGSNMRKIGVMNDDALYIIAEDYIYAYNSDNTEYTSIMCLRDYGISSLSDAGKSAWERSASGDFYHASVENIGYTVFDSTQKQQEKTDVTTEVAIIKGLQAAEVSERKELVLSAFTPPSWIYADPINKFNRYNKEYYITVKSYFNYDYAEYDTSLTRFYNDLITGKGADLFWFNVDDGIDIDNLAKKEVLTDLYTYMDDDNDIKRDDFIPSVLSALDSDGELFVVAPEFKIVTIAGCKELLDENDEWGFTAMYNLLNKYNAAQLFVSEKNDTNLDKFLKYSMDLFYDKNTGECSFETDEFVNMLKLVNDIPDTFTMISNDEINDKLKKREVLLEDVDSLNMMSIKSLDADFNDIEKEYFGYPSKSHSKATIVFNYSMAMNRNSDNKDAAWDFIKYYLENFEPSMLSVFENGFDLQLDNAMNEYADDHAAQNPLGKNLTAEQADTLRGLVYNASGYKQYDRAIYNIVYEEVMSFISGQRSAEEAVKIIQNRVKLYLDEQN